MSRWLDADVQNTIRHPHRERTYTIRIVVQALTRFKRKRSFMKRTGHFRLVALATDHTPSKGHLLAMGTFIIGCVPFAPTRKIKHRDLPTVDQHGGSTIFGNIVYAAGGMPRVFICKYC